MSRISKQPFYRKQTSILAAMVYGTSALSLASLFFSESVKTWVFFIAVLILVLAVTALLRSLRRVYGLLDELRETLSSASQGDFYNRITNTRNLGELGLVAWELNEFLDSVEAFFNETNSSFRSVMKKDFNRPPLSHGMPGQFGSALGKIADTLKQVKSVQDVTDENELSAALNTLNVENLIQNLTAVQQDMIGISARVDEAERISVENRDQAHTAQTQIGQVNQQISTIDASINQVSQVSQELAQKGEAINASLDMINGITEQITMLALNASIEAARAGEQGRGFAVVADEVKNLSNNTRTAAEEIRVRLSEFQVAMASTESSTVAAKQQTDEMLETINKVTDAVGQTSRSAETTSRLLTLTRDMSFLSLLKVDHIVYKQNGYYAMLNTSAEEQRQKVSVDHHNCRLGQWYDSQEAIDRYGQYSNFKTLQQPHEVVHTAVHQAIDASNRSQLNIAVAVNSMQATEQASDKVFIHLDGILQEISDEHYDEESSSVEMF